MPTIKDIAREAGVSHGTVSNVINGRGNVSVEKMRLVLKAAQKLGYKVNSKAQRLRQGGRARAVSVFLPGVEDEGFASMYEVFQSELMQRGYSVQLYSTRCVKTTETALLEQALTLRDSAMIVCSCLPDAVSHYREEAPDVPLVFLRQPGPEQEDVMYAGFDLKLAGRQLAQQLQARGARRVGLFTNPADSPDTELFLEGFDAALPQEGVEVVRVGCPGHQVQLRAFEFFEPDLAFDHVVCVDRRREAAVRAAGAYASRHPLPRMITIAPLTAAADPDGLVYELDYKGLAHRVVQALVERLEGKKPLPGTLYLKNHGFRLPPKAPALKDPILRLLTMASPATHALNKLMPFLEKSTGIHLEITVLPSLRDVYDVLQTPARSRYELIRMDVAWMDELAQRLFRPLDEIPFDWESLLNQTIPELGDNYTVSRGVRYCLPYDPSIQLMFYRRDLLQDPTYKRMYYERYRQELEIPRSFRIYNRVAGFFTREVNHSSPTAFGSTAAVGNVSVSPSEFIPRLLEEGGSLLDDRGRIAFNSPQALRALQNYQETYAYSDRAVYDFWKNALEGFADGSAAMTIVFINYASHILNLKMSSIAGNLGFAPVPGYRPLLGGGVVGITRDCAHPETACAFLSWLYSDAVAPVITMLGGLSPCRSAYANRDINERYPWLSTARKSFPHAYRRGSSDYYENFSELQLESILAAHIQKAVLGVESPGNALDQAQRACESHFRKRKER